jgi:hypothetical protein
VLTSLLMVFFFVNAQEDLSPKKDLAAHATVNAQTGPVGHVSLGRSPGANLNTDLLLASLSVTVVDRLSLGTVPVLYLVPEHKWNLAAKYFFWKGQEFFWALASSFVYYSTDDVLPGTPPTPYSLSLDVYSLQLAVNYLPIGSPWSFGLSVSQVYTDARFTLDTSLKIKSHITEPAFDASYSWSPTIDTTLGLGYLRNEGLSAFESNRFSYGLSLRWIRPGLFLSAPQFGIHHTPSTDNVLYLFSTTLY